MRVSLIICSIDDTRFARASQMYQAALSGIDFELIRISDARSLAEGYNRGTSRAVGELLVFSHDDVEFAAPRFWQRVENHMEHCDVLGVAGTRYYAGSQWGTVGVPFLAGQVANPLSTFQANQPGYFVSIFGVTAPRMDGMQVVDGLFMAVRRSVLDRVRFDDATFDGFHGYDIDFTLTAYQRGFRIAVGTDLVPIHLSAGKFDHVWEKYAARIAQKHRAVMPPLIARQYRFAGVHVTDKQELLQVMLPDEFPLKPTQKKSGLNVSIASSR